MPTYNTTNTVLKVSRNVSVSATNGTSGNRTGTGVLTTASNEYAILNVSYGNSSGSTQVFSVGTTSQGAVTILLPDTIYVNSCATATGLLATIYVGPSTTIYYGTTDTSAGPSQSRISFSGVVFINNP